jgi:hypothetical protein
MVQQDQLVLLACRGQQETLDLMVYLARLERQDQRVSQVRLGFLVFQELQELVEQLGQ